MSNEWRPIDTRPRDGEFLAYDPVSGKQDVCYATSLPRIGLGVVYYDIPSCSAVQQDGEYGPEEDEFQGDRATHWMPLPEPPKDAK